MNEVTNNHTGPLGVGGIVIPAKSSAEVPNWDKVSKNGVVQRWLDSGVLSLGKADKKSAQESEVAAEVVQNVQFTEQTPVQDGGEADDEDEQKAALIAQLKELDIKADKRSSVEKLQEKLDEALAR